MSNLDIRKIVIVCPGQQHVKAQVFKVILCKKNQQLVFMYNNQSLKTSVWLLYIKTSFDHANGYYV